MRSVKINRFLGGILLISGTTIGAGMLAIPVATVFTGFFPSLIFLAICWLLMLASAFFFLDVNLVVRGEPNLISMAGKTLGSFGRWISWVVYLLLLYSLIAAYISASSSFFIEGIAPITGYQLPRSLALFCLPCIFGWFIYLGTSGVDYVNRILMFGLAISYFFIVSSVPSHLTPSFLTHVDWPAGICALPILITSFGYHIIIPSLTTYMQHDAKLLRWTILIGSTIPFLVYVLWQLLVIGNVPFSELVQSAIKGESGAVPLAAILKNPWISKGVTFFSFFAIVTSFLGVALSLSDFLTDGFKIKKTWEGRLMALALTFIPPLVFVFTYQTGFYLALEYAGAFVAILLGLLPALMAWSLKQSRFYKSFIGKLLLLFVITSSVAIIIIDILQESGYLKPLIARYQKD